MIIPGIIQYDDLNGHGHFLVLETPVYNILSIVNLKYDGDVSIYRTSIADITSPVIYPESPKKAPYLPSDKDFILKHELFRPLNVYWMGSTIIGTARYYSPKNNKGYRYYFINLLTLKPIKKIYSDEEYLDLLTKLPYFGKLKLNELSK